MRVRKMSGDEQGTSAVEFAIIVSLVFIVLFGIIQFGIAYNRYQSINAGAREGARLASLKNSQVDPIQDRVLESLSILNPNNFKGAGGSRIYQCNSAALATERGCVEVYQQNGDGTWPTTPLTSGTGIPCDATHQNLNVRVVVKYKMLITIPLWSSPTVTATGTGQFRCE